MKINVLRILTVVIVAFGMLTVQSCDTDPCLDVDCGLNGTCFEGSCLCDAGYDGTDCNIVIRSLFTGTYDVQEFCDSDLTFEDNYVSNITESSFGVEYIVLDNIYNFSSFDDVEASDAAVLASVSNSGGVYTLLIENQTFVATSLAGFEVSGSGTYDTSTSVISVTYSITDTTLDPSDPAYIDNCIQTYVPQ